MATAGRAFNLLTIDVEDWYHLSGEQIRGNGVLRPDILTHQVERMLELLARHGCRATFFCLGGSLQKVPAIVHRIAAAGHEIGTHGWGHQPIFKIGLEAFHEDLKRSIDWLQDVTGNAVLGYRAPAFSVAAEQLQGFYDICLECGLVYDSSVFPIRGPRYGIPDAPVETHTVRQCGQRRLIEIPLSTVDWCGRRWPVSGGGYWRLMPKWLIGKVIERLNRTGRMMVTYVHPYEFDSRRLSGFAAAGRSRRTFVYSIKQNLRRGTMYGKLDYVLGRFRFGAVEDYLRETGRL